MNEDVKKILDSILDDVIEEIHRIIRSDVGVNKKTGFNTLEFSELNKNVKGTVYDESIDVEFPHYIVFVEWTRPEKYKNPPPYGVILDWLKRKNIRPTAFAIKTVEQLAWMMRYVIWRDGWTERIIAGLNRDYTGQSPLDNYIDKQWQEKWADELFDAITMELDKFFEE